MSRGENVRARRLAVSAAVATVVALVGTSCSSVPKAPTVGGAHRRPVNSTEAIEVQSLRVQLKNTQLLLKETANLAAAASAALASTGGGCPAPKVPPGDPQPRAAPPAAESDAPPAASLPHGSAENGANKVYVLLFPYSSTQVDLLERDALELAGAVAHAPFVEVRGRTDGALDEAGNQRVARGRAESVRDYLVAIGMDPARIRVTYQAVGDHIADNAREEGRTLNRRAEVEIYSTEPSREVLMTRTQTLQPEDAYASR